MKFNHLRVLQTKFIKVVICCIVFCSITPVYSATPWLHVVGNQIQDPAGNQVVLRGVALIDIGIVELDRGGVIPLINRLTDKTDTQGSYVGWQTKVVRLAVYPSDQGGSGSWCFDDDPDYYYDNLLRPVVDYCASKGLYVIIDWHYISNTVDHIASTSAFWNYIAPKFANESHVIYELFNEPTDTSWPVVKANMQTWINIVRSYAPDNLILVSGPRWSQDIAACATNPVSGGNIAYVSHIYPSHWIYSNAYHTNQILTCAAVHPVVMTEWGFTSDLKYDDNNHLLIGTVTNYGQPLMDFIEQHKIGNTAWCADYSWGPPMFNTDWTLRCGNGEMGCFVKDTLYLRRGDDQPSDLTSNEPKPVDGATDAPRNAVLSWEPGVLSAGHDVYFGTSESDVTAANRSNPLGVLVSIDQAPCTYDPCGLLIAETNYYWRIDEVNSNDVNVWPGRVWEFKTGKGLAVESFDSYSDSNTLRAVWKSNLISGADVCLETAKIHSSGQSMKYNYDDISSSNYCSEADVNTLSLPSGIGRDWTAGGVKALAIYFYGQAGNESNEPMFVRLYDADSNAMVTYGDYGEDTSGLKEPWWHEWNIALSDFAGVDQNNVTKITLGFGDKTGPDAEGNVYFDDIRLYAPRCISGRTTADVNGDCFVDCADLEILTDYWLVPVSATAPSDANLVGKWILDGDACDTSGYNNDGILTGGTIWVPGRHPDKNGLAIEFFDEDTDYVNFGTDASLNLTTKATVATWIKTNDAGDGQTNAYVSKGHFTDVPIDRNGAYGIWHNAGNNIEFFIYVGPTMYSAAYPVGSSFNEDWHHVAGTYDGINVKLYIDGQLKAAAACTGNININNKRLLMGASETGNSSNQTYYCDAKIDEVYIYSRVLSQGEIMYLSEKHVDLNKDGMVNFKDFASLAEKWLEENLWP